MSQNKKIKYNHHFLSSQGIQPDHRSALLTGDSDSLPQLNILLHKSAHMLIFSEGEKPDNPKKKPLGIREKNTSN